MHTYANIQNGVVVEIIQPMTDENGNEIPIANRFTSQFVADLVDITTVSPEPQQGWTYSDSTFSAPSGPTSAQQWSAFQQIALAALTESDKTILRCYENQVTVPAAWANYRKALRAIVGNSTGTVGALPSIPSYPPNT